ncbi:branched-chain amino acid ABC transporter permease [Clostridiales bacterium PH28_bin88]|nr:branched-chain amino acid ABC transporter permease [Clostridiales bacterium PH28_bin88]
MGKRWYLPLGAVFLVYPFVVNTYWVDVANFFGIYTLLGLSLNIIVGHAGLYNLGHAAFYAVGAYSTAILNTVFHVPILLLLPVSALLAALAGYLVSKPILHLRGDYLAIVTIGFGEIMRIALNNNPFNLTGGPNGIMGIGRPELFGFRVYLPIHYYFFIWLLVVVVIFALKRLENSRIGRAWNYIREDELAAEAMGIDTTRMKVLAFVMGAALAGVAGNIYASKVTVIAPESFGFWESVVMFSIIVLGGPGSIPGVLVGTLGMFVLPEIFRGFASARMLVFGLAMMLMMVFRPEGLWPSQRYRQAVRDSDEELGAVRGAKTAPGSLKG